MGVLLALFTQPGPANDESARVAIDDLLHQRYNALLTRDLESYMQTVDPARVFLRGCEQERFEAYIRVGARPDAVTLGRMDRWGDYLRIWLDTPVGWQRSFARFDGARWWMSEPTSDELGEDLSKDFSGVTVQYRGAEADLVDAVGAELESIIPLVRKHAASPPSHLFTLRLATLTSTSGSCFVAGEARGRGSTVITLREVGLTPGYDHVSRTTSATLEHEALHWLQIDRSASSMLAMDWWLVEGWPYLIANTDVSALLGRRDAVCEQPQLRYQDLRLGPLPNARPEDANRDYVAASLLVDRISKTGGDTAYWALFDAFGDNTVDPFTRVVGTDGPSFFDAWLADARHQYC